MQCYYFILIKPKMHPHECKQFSPKKFLMQISAQCSIQFLFKLNNKNTFDYWVPAQAIYLIGLSKNATGEFIEEPSVNYELI